MKFQPFSDVYAFKAFHTSRLKSQGVWLLVAIGAFSLFSLIIQLILTFESTFDIELRYLVHIEAPVSV